MSPRSIAEQSAESVALASGLTAVVLWSSVATGFKLGLDVLTPLQLVLLGTIVSTALFAIVWGYRRLRGQHHIQATSLWQILQEAAPLALINPLCYYPVLLMGYERLPAQIAQPLNYTWALVLAVLAVPILKQPLSLRLACGLLVSYGGATLLVLGGRQMAQGAVDNFGVVLIVLSTLLWALYWLLNTRTKRDPLLLMLTSFALAVPPLAALTYWQDGWPPLTQASLGYGLWIGLIEMGVTFLMWQLALRRTRQAARIGQLIFLAPFLSLIPIYLVLQEPILWTSVVGLAVIVTGLLITGPPPSPIRARQ